MKVFYGQIVYKAQGLFPTVECFIFSWGAAIENLVDV